VPARENAIVNRLNKTKVEKEVDHEAERQARLKAEGRVKKAAAIEQVSMCETDKNHSITGLIILMAASRRSVKQPRSGRYGKNRRRVNDSRVSSQKKLLKSGQHKRTRMGTISCEVYDYTCHLQQSIRAGIDTKGIDRYVTMHNACVNLSPRSEMMRRCISNAQWMFVNGARGGKG
jgi:hypothetical protein